MGHPGVVVVIEVLNVFSYLIPAFEAGTVKSDRWASPIIFVPRIRISCTGRHQPPRMRLSLRKAA
jgi:hypothetical protein